jgi:hypothetical protein
MNLEQSIDKLLILSSQMFVEIDAAKLEFDKLIIEAMSMLDRVQAMQVKVEGNILEFKQMIKDENERQAG